MQHTEEERGMPKCQLVSLDFGTVAFQGHTGHLAGNFILPCPVTTFPNLEQLSNEHLRWMIENGLLEKNDIAKYKTLKFAHLFTSAVSDLPLHFAKYMPICAHLMWIIDNPLETACRKIEDIEALKCICDLIVQCLAGKYAEFKDSASHPAYKYKEVCFQDNLPILCRALDTFQQEIRDYATLHNYTFFDENWQRFCKEFRYSLDGAVWAGTEKIKKNHLSKDLYLKLREATSGVSIICILSATLLNLNLSKVMQENNVIFSTMSTLGNLIISIMNDIASLRAEIKQAQMKETYNENFIINVFHLFKSKARSEVHPLQESIARAIKIHNKMMVNFLSLLDSTKNISLTLGATSYFGVILQHIRDNFDWNFITARYGLEKSSVIQDERIVDLNELDGDNTEDPSRSNFDTTGKSVNKNHGSNPNTWFRQKNKIFSDETPIVNGPIPWNFTIGHSE